MREYLQDCEPLLAQCQKGDTEIPRWCRELRGSLETLLFQQTGVLLSLHLPLVEAPGFRPLLAAVFGTGFFLHYREIVDCHGQTVQDIQGRARCIHGHFNAADLRAHFPGARLITWVREPVQRVVAHYEYWHRLPDRQNPVCRELLERNWSLLEFARQDAVRNEVTRFFGGLRPADFAFIGILEAPAESVDLLLNRLQLGAVPIFNDYRAGLAPRADRLAVSAQDAAEIERLNELDCRLYAECLEWFQHAQRAMRP